MKSFIICLALIAASLAQTNTVAIEPPRPAVICPMVSPPKIPEGCQLETTMNDAHCPVPKVVCPSCDLLKCDETQQCRVVDGKAKCFAKVCPLAMPGRIPPGCNLENEVDENGCSRPRIVCSKSLNEDCGENMEMKSCGSPCPETCEQVVTGVYSRCPRNCIPNVCQCKQGFALDENNKCVARETCARQPRSAEKSSEQCQENAELKECGSMCPATCEMIVTGVYPPCPAMCKRNVCQCKEGFVLDENNKCVASETCARQPRSAEPSTDQCQENEEVKECGSMCPTTCQMIVTGLYPPCPAMCKFNVCQCKDGYAYDGQRRCVKVEDCRHRAELRGNRSN